MKKIYVSAALLLSSLCAANVYAIDLGKAIGGLKKAASAYTISDEQLRQYVGQAVKDMDSKNTVMPDNSAYTQRLRRLTSGLTAINGVPLNFKVYQNKEINAFASADGSVRVYTGLMDLMDDNELLGVVGHELGHVALNHSRNAMRNDLLTSAGMDAVASINSTASKLTESQLAKMGEALLSTSYSRKQETEADDFGYDFLKGAGKNPWAMALAFVKLQNMEGNGAAQSLFTRFFSDHPDTQSRINHMAARAKADGYALPSEEAKQQSTPTTSTSSKTTSTKTSTKKTTSKKSTTKKTTTTKSTSKKSSSSKGFTTSTVSSSQIGSATQRALQQGR